MTTLLKIAEELCFSTGHRNYNTCTVPVRLVVQLEQAIAQEQVKPKFTRFDVLVITTAYEQGYGKGLQDQGVPNVYTQDSPAFHAWQLGYEEGQMRLKQSKEPKP